MEHRKLVGDCVVVFRLIMPSSVTTGAAEARIKPQALTDSGDFIFELVQSGIVPGRALVDDVLAGGGLDEQGSVLG